ncbi:MAG: DUF86 domain-containing protein [Acidobacteriaceae bacterium]|nr:DUF86 domain-containing protein [Acidobacteriaceae bacterium]
MARDATIVLDEILDDFEGSRKRPRTREEIEAEFMVFLGIQRAIEIISEASRHIPAELLDTERNIPWSSIRGMGNVLRHEYHRIASDVIWDAIQHDLPQLKSAIERMMTIARP